VHSDIFLILGLYQKGGINELSNEKAHFVENMFSENLVQLDTGEIFISLRLYLFVQRIFSALYGPWENFEK
jgi:hypothetical protein